MKTRLETDIECYRLRLVLLFKLAYSDAADLISSFWNTNEESGPSFSVFSVFQAKARFEGKKIAKLVHLQLLTEKVYDSHHGLILKLKDQRLLLRAKFKFYPLCLARNVLWTSESNFFKKTKKRKVEKQEKVASFPSRGRKNLRIYSWYSLPDFKHDQKRFIRIPSLNVPEMRPLGTF